MAINVDGYFEYLIDQVYDDELDLYTEVLRVLFQTPFEALPENESRAVDGLQMRYHYSSEWDVGDDQCSLLELFVNMAKKMENIGMDPFVGYNPYRYFKSILEALGLWIDDGSFYKRPQVVQNAIYAFNKDNTIWYTSGSLWEQMMRYLNDEEELI